MSIDYSVCWVGNWKDGQLPNTDSCLVVVNYDQKNTAYVIEKDQYDDFCEHVMVAWFDGYDIELDAPEVVFEKMGLSIKRTDLEDV